MSYVLQRDDGQFVAPLGSEHSYTKNVLKARQFATEGAAELERCKNERVVSLRDLFGGE